MKLWSAAAAVLCLAGSGHAVPPPPVWDPVARGIVKTAFDLTAFNEILRNLGLSGQAPSMGDPAGGSQPVSMPPPTPVAGGISSSATGMSSDVFNEVLEAVQAENARGHSDGQEPAGGLIPGAVSALPNRHSRRQVQGEPGSASWLSEAAMTLTWSLVEVDELLSPVAASVPELGGPAASLTEAIKAFREAVLVL
ncbi:hypothetical protein B0I35DRAFT_405765 [Stachybotrys elegans]|uniref:Uncharacterized protein n=1 Tax=Stachybotrys elegans TaxID=80388 RepID=A0A8K0T5K1_9HYPO|nr:hypothetical protein B0I35DRAFT_405765 [Stachybotrys elegans]